MELYPESQASQPATQVATQPATQPYIDPRRLGQEWSGVSEEEAADIICVLHANTETAVETIETTMLRSPEHVLQNDDIEDLTEADLAVYPEIDPRIRHLALRMSATVKSPKEGFKFGRNPDTCDILLTKDAHNRLISNAHFRIFVNDQGSLMLEDVSTNGTWLDNEPIKTKDKFGNLTNESNLRVLRHGSIIGYIPRPDRKQVKLMVRLPIRTLHEQAYDRNLRHYLRVRGFAPKFASIRESSFGNHWNGGEKYNFTGILGKGAFATVYRLQHKYDGRIIAAKEIDSRKFVKNGELDVKFDNELRIMRVLKHPNIVDFIGCEIHNHFVYLFMEHVPYGDLASDLHLLGFLPERDVQTITKQTLRALDYMHRRGVTHRDVKPDNILISTRAPLVIKLSDFGLSKSVVEKNTFLRTFCGTLLYCAPEVYPEYNYYLVPPFKRRRPGDPGPIIPDTPYNSSADMWSFAAVIFHLLAGDGPVPAQGGTNGQAMLEAIMTREIDYRPLRQKSVSEAGIDFIQGLLNRQPHLRPTEEECFKHRWLRDVPDVLDYSSVGVVQRIHPRHMRLETVEEGNEDEDDEEVLHVNMSQVAGESISRVLAPTNRSPARPTKKPKMLRAETGIPEEIMYPHMASGSQPQGNSERAVETPKLFGEITASVLKSSGLFGMGAGGAPVDADVESQEDIPQLRDQMQQVDMDDLSKIPSAQASNPQHGLGIGENLPPDIDAARAQINRPPSASSLFGAEKQLGQMHMKTTRSNSNTRPATANQIGAIMQRDGFLESPSPSMTESLNLSVRTKSNGPVRRIDTELLKDDVAFAAERRRRDAVREEKARMKAQTFNGIQGQYDTLVRSAVGREFGASERQAPRGGESENMNAVVPQEQPDSIPAAVNPSSLPSYGNLEPIEGSISNRSIQLTQRMTVWGRAPNCTLRYENLKDTRIPKYGIKVIFHSPGIEDIERSGGDWRQVSGIRTIIATSARKGIWVNGAHLTRETGDSSAALYGKLYTGDIITVVDTNIMGTYLRYKVEILFGDSARPRPDEEYPFVLQTETMHHARMRAQAVLPSTRSFTESLASSPPVQ